MDNTNQNAELKLAYEIIAKLHQIALGEADVPNNVDVLEYADYIINNFYNDIDEIDRNPAITELDTFIKALASRNGTTLY